MTETHCDHLVDYLSGTLSPKETREFEEHLTTCKDCQEIVEVTGELPYLAESAEPPAGMKSRILSNVFEEEQETPAPLAAAPAKEKTQGQPKAMPMKQRTVKRSWWTPLIAAVLLVSLLGNAYAFWQLSDREDPAGPTQSAFNSVNLEPTETFAGTGTAAIIRDEDSLELVVQATELEELQEGQVYQVWLIRGDEPIPAGAFTANPDGEGATHYNLEDDIEGWDTIAITLEPQAGNQLPQGEVVLSSGI
ncbi:MAG TPA: anti-sigma factor [Planococcus sp. (in: firmicutes)]|nr:anti-sigma factor [Planococcus sp. (in: firmicutes)]